MTALCAVGLYASLYMLRKTLLAERGRLDAPSIVEEPHARLFFGVPNALLGSVAYPLVATGVWLPPLHRLAAAIVAACVATSVFLAYSLLFVTKRRCPYCWTAHAVNVLLAVCIPYALFGAP